MLYDSKIIQELLVNRQVFKELLSTVPQAMCHWKPMPDKWCLLEIVCHLYDEECEDFRLRTRQVLETPSLPLPPIDPQGWVETRKYMEQNYSAKLDNFLAEREASVKWLESLTGPKWNNSYVHPRLGKMTAGLFLSNWLAHDYLHIRQIIRLKYDYLKIITDEDLGYAGDW